MHKKTEVIIQAAIEELKAYHPMTVRQVYYRLVSRVIIENNRSQYQGVCNILVYARRNGLIPWEWIEDRTRQPYHVSMWRGLEDYKISVLNSYRRDTWKNQSVYIECWVEKNALFTIFHDILQPYGITLHIGRGYDGWSSIHDAAEVYKQKETTILYFGDFDPSGVQMFESLRDRLYDQGGYAHIIKVALNLQDIYEYHLPPRPEKIKDNRTRAFQDRYGKNSCVELDALPIEVLQTRLKNEIEKRLDLQALAAVKEQEKDDRERLAEVLRK
jgi:hypothetical protein